MLGMEPCLRRPHCSWHWILWYSSHKYARCLTLEWWTLYLRSIFSSGQWTFFSWQGALVFYTLKNPGWPEMNLALPSSPFWIKGVVILFRLEAALTLFINCQLQLGGFPNLEVSHWLNGIVIANPNKTSSYINHIWPLLLPASASTPFTHTCSRWAWNN